jgi:mannose-1-phosphate guanylyltransferase
MNKNNYCIILADSIENNSWSLLNHPEVPKQFLDTLYIGKTLLQITYEQFCDLIPHENFVIVTGKFYKNLVLEQLPMLKPAQVLTELYYRDTVPGITYATYKIYTQNKEAVITVTTSDQYMGNKIQFAEQMQTIIDNAASNETLIALGINPTFPATNQDYLQIGETNKGFSSILGIHKKPDLEKVKQFIASTKYLWNSGIYTWSVKSIKAALEKYTPDMALQFANIGEDYGTPNEQEVVNSIYEKCEERSITYLLERAENLYAYRSLFNWNDINLCKQAQDKINHKKEDINMISNDNNKKYTHGSDYFIEELSGKRKTIIDGQKNYIFINKDNSQTIWPKDDKYLRLLTNSKALIIEGNIDWNDIKLIREFHKLIYLNLSEVLKVKRMLFNTFPHDSITKMKRLKEIAIPRHIAIDSLAIVDCQSLERIIVPEETTTINIGLVFNCKNFKEFVVDEANTSFSTVDRVLLSKDGKKLISVPCGTKNTYTVADSVTYIERGAFFGCRQIEKVVCDLERVTIHEKAFIDANKIKIIKTL